MPVDRKPVVRCASGLKQVVGLSGIGRSYRIPEAVRIGRPGASLAVPIRSPGSDTDTVAEPALALRSDPTASPGKNGNLLSAALRLQNDQALCPQAYQYVARGSVASTYQVTDTPP